MNEKIEKVTEMPAVELMSFVKECCEGDEVVKRQIATYSGCGLQWIKKVNNFIVFTVLAGKFDRGCVRNASEYITVSFNTETKKVSCLTHYLSNYGGYNIYFSTKENCIKQEIGRPFGSWEYSDLNLDLTKITSQTKQDFGCCCG